MCSCDTTIGRLHGKCMDYKSSGRSLSSDLQKLLFPQDKNKLAVIIEIPKYDKTANKSKKDKYVHQLQSFCDYLEDGLLKREQQENLQIIK